MVKRIIKKYFDSLAFYYSYLGYRVFVILLFSLLVGALDAFGLAMFLPLLKMINDAGTVEPESLGRLRFLLDFLQDLGIKLNLLTILVFMAVLFFFKGAMQYLAGVYRVNMLQWFVRKLRLQNIKGLNNLAYKHFVSADIGRIQNTLTGEVDRVAISFSNYFIAMQFGVMVIVYMAIAFRLDPQFALLVTAGGVLTNFLYKNLYTNTKGASRRLTGENNIFQSLIIQNVANYKYLKATGSLKKYAEKLQGSVLKIEKSNKKIGKLDALLVAGREPILVSVVVVVIYVQTAYLGSDLGPIIMSLLLFYRALNYLMQMQARWNKFLSVSGSLENMKAFGKELRANKEKKSSIILKESIGSLKLSRVSFHYGKATVLKNINLNISKNETLAFVGESGSGKTTLVNIIAGLLPVDDGEYYINSKESKDIFLDSFQKKIGYITQDPVIFNDTLFNNVTFWEEDEEKKERFWNAVNQAALGDFIEGLALKEQTILGNNGVNLSGGQKQRISIARELYKNVEILILDEATSALDSETEKAIQKNIDQLKGNFTILIVAHRISTIKNADRIVVMKNGEIQFVDNFQNLLAKSEYFKRLVELQEV
ncbi:ATP-binding cassette, subfamily B, MsbA [Salegentibacter echinorum]|uniref:ATP-binding cassette, subfamily B, MsbA n=1 Tax=Salegentibacter echinorum TaxID=1073325 RepID=A0A1M5FIB2_SALEC|nr:ABC transporter ATP-binding protein [Salegentibacter echinorum]SHF91159.1 ATP-binding cassette, subfamily B, MsbA [Salegentibacter echinorum]